MNSGKQIFHDDMKVEKKKMMLGKLRGAFFGDFFFFHSKVIRVYAASFVFKPILYEDRRHCIFMHRGGDMNVRVGMNARSDLNVNICMIPCESKHFSCQSEVLQI